MRFRITLSVTLQQVDPVPGDPTTLRTTQLGESSFAGVIDEQGIVHTMEALEAMIQQTLHASLPASLVREIEQARLREAAERPTMVLRSIRDLLGEPQEMKDGAATVPIGEVPAPKGKGH